MLVKLLTFFTFGAFTEGSVGSGSGLFDTGMPGLTTFYIDVNETRLAESAVDEEYVHCTVEVKGHVVRHGAGCRYKGSTGQLHYCLDGAGMLDTERCSKLSLKIDPNYFVTSGTVRTAHREILGERKLLLHGMGVDPSMLSEITAMNLLDQIGAIAPRAVFARLFVNLDFRGVYTLVEYVGKGFFTRRRTGGDADEHEGQTHATFYKAAWIPAVAEWHVMSLRKSGTNRDALLLEISASIGHAVYPDTADSLMLQYFDVEQLARVLAVDAVVGQTDGWSSKHNFFWVVPPNSNRLVMVPFDYDRLNDIAIAKRTGNPSRSEEPYPWWTSMPLGSLTHDPRCSKYNFVNAHGMGDYDSRWAVLDAPIICDPLTRLMVTSQTFMRLFRSNVLRAYELTDPAVILPMWSEWVGLIDVDVVPQFKTRAEWGFARTDLMDYILHRRRDTLNKLITIANRP